MNDYQGQYPGTLTPASAMPSRSPEYDRALAEKMVAQQNIARGTGIAGSAAPKQTIMDEIAEHTHRTAGQISEQASILESLAERIIGPGPAAEAVGTGRNTIEPGKPSIFVRIQHGAAAQEQALERLRSIVNRLARIA